MDKLRPFLPKDYCWRTAKAILRVREREVEPKALITTGFFVAGAPETDGPPGAFFLYRALKRLGFLTRLITDAICAPLFENILPDNDFIRVPVGWEEESVFAERIFESFLPHVLIAVERCGRTRDGSYRDMRGKDISSVTAPLDALFLNPPEGCLTVGIGDGGNEIGMGKFVQEISRFLPIPPCVVPADHVILSGVSNWGAFGLIRCLEVLSGVSCFPKWEEVEAFVVSIVSKGAVDGISGKCELKVDGYGLSETRGIMNALRGCEMDFLGEETTGSTLGPEGRICQTRKNDGRR